MTTVRTPRARWWIAACASVIGVGCHDADHAVDPDALEHSRAAQLAPLPEVRLDELVGAVAAVPAPDAARVLEGWLAASPTAAPLLQAWARTRDGTLDLSRAPVSVRAVEASIGPGPKSRCGEVTVLLAGDVGPTLRARLPIPRSAPSCRGIQRASRLTGAEAAPLLAAAIAEARVPVTPPPRVVAAN